MSEPAPAWKPSPWSDGVLGALLFLSGAAALIDEHLLSKLLVRVVGSSAEAVACVLVAFMGGMGVGAAIVARHLQRAPRAREPHPFRRYALVELGIAASSLALPAVLGAVVQGYAGLARGADASASLLALRFVVAALVVSVPGILMGATLPLIVDGASRLRGGAPLPLARLYAANTLGAAAGVLASTYLLIPSLGILRTIVIAGGCNIAAALGALWLDRQRNASPAATSLVVAAEDAAVPLRRALVLSLGSGALSFAFEVVSFRLLAVVVGNSVYAFGLMLFVFLLGNGIGSRAASAMRRPRPLALALALAAVGLAALSTMSLWDTVPSMFQRVGRFAPSFVLWEGTRLVAAALLIGLPTLAMGAAFGLLLRIAGGEGAEAGPRVARLYVANTIGAIAGTLLATFVVAPNVGSQLALVLIAMGEVGLACIALVPAIGARRQRLAIAGAFVVAMSVLLALGSTWNVATLMSGSNVYFSEGFSKYERLRWLSEDRAGSMVAVVETQNTKTLLSNGKFEGNDGFEVPDQQMFALFPLLFVHQHRAALNIGIGTANTLAVMGAFPFQRIDAVDISSAIVDAARVEFAALNRGILDDSRVHVHIDDGRNFLLRTATKYDLITVQLTSIWIGGAADLYNLEFYDSVRDRLTEDGVFKQWVQLHHAKPIDLARIIATLRARFPHVSLWLAGHQGVLLASQRPLRADASALRRWPDSEPIRRTLTTSGLEHPFAAFGHYVMDTAGLDAFVGDAARQEGTTANALLSRDESATLEYSTPRGNLLLDAVGDNMEALRRHSDPDVLKLVTDLDGDAEKRLLLAYAARERGFLRIAGKTLSPVADRFRVGPHGALVKQLEAARARGVAWP